MRRKRQYDGRHQETGRNDLAENGQRRKSAHHGHTGKTTKHTKHTKNDGEKRMGHRGMESEADVWNGAVFSLICDSHLCSFSCVSCISWFTLAFASRYLIRLLMVCQHSLPAWMVCEFISNAR